MTEAQEIIRVLKNNGMSYRSIGAAIGKKAGTISRAAKGITKGDRLLPGLRALVDLSPNIARTLAPYVPPPLSPVEQLYQAKMEEWRRMGGHEDDLPEGLHLFRPRHSWSGNPYIAMSRNAPGSMCVHIPEGHESQEAWDRKMEEYEEQEQRDLQEKELRKKVANTQRTRARRKTMKKQKTEDAIVGTVVAGAVLIGVAVVKLVLS